MIEHSVKGHNLPEAYHNALRKLQECGEISDCADWDTTQKELSMTIEVTNPLAEPMISKCFIGGTYELQQYMMEMLDGILDFEVELGNWAYTYHQRYADQYQFVIDELRRNPSSRRAVMLIWDKTKDDYSEEPPCFNHCQFFIRNNKLDMKVLFRSNDACKATFMNAFALIMLQKRIADELGIEVGTYVHRANSFHCYEKDFQLLAGYVGRIESSSFEDLTYDYEGDWKEEMEEAIPDILKKVEELKSHGIRQDKKA